MFSLKMKQIEVDILNSALLFIFVPFSMEIESTGKCIQKGVNIFSDLHILDILVYDQ